MGRAVTSSANAHTLRLVFAYKIASLVVLGISLVWIVLALRVGAWLLFAADSLLAVIASTCWLLLYRDKYSTALVFAEFGFLVFIVMFCLVLDTPNKTAPRVSHLYLLVLAALGYFNYLRTGSWVQLTLIALSVTCFVSFSSVMLVFPFAHPVPDEFRSAGTWFNSVLATGLLCVCIHVMQMDISKGKGLVRELKSALWNEEFELFYQKQVDADGNAIGCEALLRWRHPTRGYVSPGEFIPIAEQAGMMPDIGGWVIAEACKTLSRWQNEPSTAHLMMSVNVSIDQFLVEDFDRHVMSALALHQLPASRLKLELTESVAADDIEPVIARMNALRTEGITISLDDFGTGYSSLSYLRRLPLQQLKIDRSFVEEATSSSRGASILRSIVQLGHDLELTMIAEGVETVEQFELLKELGCEGFQGFLFGKPVSRMLFEQDVCAVPVREEA